MFRSRLVALCAAIGEPMAARSACSAFSYSSPTITTTVVAQHIRMFSKRRVPVILTQDLDLLGSRGQEVLVKPGRARNHLVPGRMAVYATPETRAQFVVQRSEEEEKALQTNRDLNLLCARFQGVQLRYTRATTDGVHLYGSVSLGEILESLVEHPQLSTIGLTEGQLRVRSAEADAGAAAAKDDKGTSAAARTSDATSSLASWDDVLSDSDEEDSDDAGAKQEEEEEEEEEPVAVLSRIKRTGPYFVDVRVAPKRWVTVPLTVVD